MSMLITFLGTKWAVAVNSSVRKRRLRSEYFHWVGQALAE
jgi:hypothetical protein